MAMEMQHGSAIPLGQIEKLNENNYHIWKGKVNAALKSRHLFYEVIEAKEPPPSNEPESAEAKKRAEWQYKNDEAFGLIFVTISERLAGPFITETRAKTLWNELKRIYTGHLVDKRIDTALELRSIKMLEKEKVNEYITRIRSIVSKCALLGLTFEEREVVYYAVRGLHPRYGKVAAVLKPNRGMSLEEVQQAVEEEEKDLLDGMSALSLNNGFREKAYRARVMRGGRHNFTKDEARQKCYVCGRVGHVARFCWYRHGNRETEHRKPGKSCQEKPQKPKSPNKQKEQALHASAPRTDFTTTYNWYLDSGCTSHMCSNDEYLVNKRQCDIEVNLAEAGRSIVAEACGDMKVIAKDADDDGNDVLLRIEDTLYVPELRNNLLSIKKLTDKGKKVLFEKEQATIIDSNGEVIALANMKNEMFVLETIPREVESITANVAKTTGEEGEIVVEDNVVSEIGDNCGEPQVSDSTDGNSSGKNDAGTKLLPNSKSLWHKRLGHPGDECLEKMKSKDVVIGLQFDSRKCDICEACVMGKFTQAPFRPVNYDYIKRPLELIHVDLCGPMPVLSLGGSRYFMTVVDTYSRCIFVFFLKTKDEAYEAFETFVLRAENETGERLKAVRSDNGGEFINERFRRFCRDRGVTHQTTVAYTPQSNSVCERANRTVLEKGKCLLFDAELPAQFWAEAISTAAYLKNRIPSKNDEDMTPLEKWSQKKPNVSYLKVFGCLCYYYVPQCYRSKLEPKGAKGIFVGYSNTKKAYRVYDCETRSIHEVRSVKFSETKKGSALLHEHVDRDDIKRLLTVDNELYGATDDDECEVTPVLVDKNVVPSISDESGMAHPEMPSSSNEEPEMNEPSTSGRKPGISNEEAYFQHQMNLIERE